jgi:zinc-binding alcohol dehydrogenase family protein
VIGSASRQETIEWVLSLGAHHVIDHSKSLAAELKRIGIPMVTHVASLTQTESHFPEIVEILAPQGKFGLIDDPKTLDVVPFKRKSISVHWELMFTRPLFATADMIAQHRLLSETAALVDAGVIRTTLTEHFGRITAENLKRAHALLESRRSKGKIVLEGF